MNSTWPRSISVKPPSRSKAAPTRKLRMPMRPITLNVFPSWPSGAPGRERSGLRFFVDGFQAHQLKLFGSGRRLHLDLVADATPEQRLANRRGGRDQSLSGVSLFGGHQFVLHFDRFLQIEQPDARAVPGGVSRQVVQVEHGHVRQALLQLPNARRKIALALLGVLELGVLRQVAVPAGPHQLSGQLEVQLVLERLDLFFQFLLDLGERIGHGLRCSTSPDLAKAAGAALKSGATPAWLAERGGFEPPTPFWGVTA